jgi:vacuolar-type H+-ATPase subunit E/Vma4
MALERMVKSIRKELLLESKNIKQERKNNRQTIKEEKKNDVDPISSNQLVGTKA